MREFGIFTVTYEDALTFVNEMKHEDINTLRLSITEYDAIVKLYTNLLSRVRNFEYEQWIDDSNLTIALPLEQLMLTQSAIYNILGNGNLHIKVFRAVEKIAIAMSMAEVEFVK